MVIITIFILAGITLIEPMKVHGQSKVEIVRDPFLLPSGVHLLSHRDPSLIARGKPFTSSKTGDDSTPLFKLKAILISERIRLASIDRYIVKEGDSIYDEKILEIKPDRVILGKRDKKRTLLLYQSPIQVTVEER